MILLCGFWSIFDILFNVQKSVVYLLYFCLFQLSCSIYLILSSIAGPHNHLELHWGILRVSSISFTQVFSELSDFFRNIEWYVMAILRRTQNHVRKLVDQYISDVNRKNTLHIQFLHWNNNGFVKLYNVKRCRP